MADPLTYANSDEYILVNPNDPKVGHLIYDAPMVDAETKQFIRDPETGKIKVYRMVIWGTKGLTQAQVEALITQKNNTLVTRINNLDSTLTNFLDADDTTLDQLSELITEIKSNKANIALIVSNNATKEELQQAVNTINTNIANSYVDLANDQTITGDKTFTGEVNVPTVDLSDNSTQAASTEFVKNALSSITGTNLNNLVNKDEAQTITGLKTFSTLPQSSVTPTDSKDLANKQYVDDNKVSTDDCVKTSGDQTVAGIKTFTSSPLSVTPDASDNSTKVATTAFVQGKVTALQNTLNTFLDSDDTTLDQASELVAAIKANKTDIASLVANKATKAELAEVVNTLANINLSNLSASGTGVINSLIDNKLLVALPSYRRNEDWKGDKLIITAPEQISIVVNNKMFIATSGSTIDISSADSWDNSTYATAANRAGKDFYIYALENSGTTPTYILSANSTVPTGYTADNSRKVGGFHCLCVDVGIISGHTLSGYVTGNILPLSVWDLKHRPVSDPEGRVYIDEIHKWVSIYLPSWDGSKLVSRYQGTIVDGGSATAMDGEQFAEFAGLAKCELASRDEFKVFAFGSNQKTNIAGSNDPGTTGGHKDTAGRRMISNYGVEDCCGVLWQWTKDCFEAMSVSWNSANTWVEGYSWQTKSVVSTIGDSSHRDLGSCRGLLRRALVGSFWGDGADCGSRSVLCYYFGSFVFAGISARLVSDNIQVSF